ncbi:MAG TPA: nuclear transport factor 2 family protein [Luteimonas sp.]|nr:nuclear transport factor 2 family protein [Luteimonas sp.]
MHATKWFALACLAMLAGAADAATPSADEAGVRRAEETWSAAFVGGDTAALDALLDAGYVSVSANGESRDKAQVIALARSYAAAHPGAHADPLPPTSTIQVIGDAAVVRHHGDADVSVDVFHFQDGRWHAWYSQHTRLAGH